MSAPAERLVEWFRAASRHPACRRIAVAALAGALAFFLVGTPPTRLPPPTAEALAWRLPVLDTAPVAPWGMAVWASEPVDAPVGPAVAPQPRLLGTVRAAGRWRALFEMPDGRRVRAAEGERLPDGAEITAVAPTRAAWRDAEGAAHEARLLDARQP
ncbi:hypothetical protein GCM10028794_04020 [Silanimonas algicola]